MKVIDVWWTAHPHLVELAFFCLSLLIALFPERSRQWVIAPVRFSALGAFRFMQRDAKNTLDIVRLVDGDAFKLVAYIGFYCIHAFISSLWSTLIFWACINLFSYWQTKQMSSIPINVLFYGAIIGRAAKLRFLLEGLLHPEQTVKRLEKIVAGERLE